MLWGGESLNSIFLIGGDTHRYWVPRFFFVPLIMYTSGVIINAPTKHEDAYMKSMLKMKTPPVYAASNGVPGTRGDASNIHGDTSGLVGYVGNIEGDVSSIYGDASGLQGDVSELIGDVSDIRGHVGALVGDVTHLVGDITDIRGNASGLGGYMTGVRGDVSGIYGTIKSTFLSGDVSDLHGDITGIRGSVTDFMGDLDQCEITEADRAAGVFITDLLAE